MGAIVTLTTDFGLADAYVAAMKGIILGINPQARLVDICHTVQPQNILQGALVLSAAVPFFPPGTTHLVVVDPGVGTARRGIIMATPSARFVAPDNGVLSYVMESCAGFEVVALTREEYWRTPVSATFHGRDIFAPVAARLSMGYPPAEFGERVTSPVRLTLSRPSVSGDRVVGRVIHVDGFGNLITDVRQSDLPHPELVTVEIGSHRIGGLRRTYGEGEGLAALFGSSGYLEIAVTSGSAAVFLNAKIGSAVTITGGRT